MVIRIPGFLQGQHEQPGAQVGPQPGPDPAWARFTVEGGGDTGLPRPRGRNRSYQPELLGLHHDRPAVGEPELGEHRGHVVVGGLGRDVEPGGDLGVGEPAGHQPGDVELTVGQA